MKHKVCISPDCDNKLTGKQRMFCSRACAKRYRRGVKSGAIINGEWSQMAQNRDKLGMELPKTSPKRANSEVTELRRLKIQVTLRIKNRSEMRQLDNRYIGKVTRMRLEGVLKDFFNDRWVKEGVVFDIEVVSQYE